MNNHPGICGSPAQLDAVIALRKGQARHEAEMLACQRDNARDPVYAKFFKGEVKAAQRMQRAANICLGWMETGNPPARDFPRELGLEIQIVLGAASAH